MDALLLSWLESVSGAFGSVAVLSEASGVIRNFEKVGGFFCWGWGPLDCLFGAGRVLGVYVFPDDGLAVCGAPEYRCPEEKDGRAAGFVDRENDSRLIVVARNVPQARVALYQLIHDLCTKTVALGLGR